MENHLLQAVKERSGLVDWEGKVFFQDVYDAEAEPFEVVKGSCLPAKFTPASCFPDPNGSSSSSNLKNFNLRLCFDAPTRQLGLAMLEIPRGPKHNKDDTVFVKFTCMRGRRHWWPARERKRRK
jgi:hypothetical protein